MHVAQGTDVGGADYNITPQARRVVMINAARQMGNTELLEALWRLPHAATHLEAGDGDVRLTISSVMQKGKNMGNIIKQSLRKASTGPSTGDFETFERMSPLILTDLSQTTRLMTKQQKVETIFAIIAFLSIGTNDFRKRYIENRAPYVPELQKHAQVSLDLTFNHDDEAALNRLCDNVLLLLSRDVYTTGGGPAAPAVEEYPYINLTYDVFDHADFAERFSNLVASRIRVLTAEEEESEY